MNHDKVYSKPVWINFALALVRVPVGFLSRADKYKYTEIISSKLLGVDITKGLTAGTCLQLLEIIGGLCMFGDFDTLWILLKNRILEVIHGSNHVISSIPGPTIFSARSCSV